MARIYRVQGPDGAIHRIEGPDDATPMQIEAAARQVFAVRQPQGADAINPTEGMSEGQKIAAGAGKAVADIGRGAKQSAATVAAFATRPVDTEGRYQVPEYLQSAREEIAESRRLDQPLMETGAGQLGNVAGNLAVMAVPMAGLGLAAKGASLAGQAGLSNRLMQLATSSIAPRTTLGSISQGATYGALAPSGSTEETIRNIGLSGIAGGAGQIIPRAIGLGARTGIAAATPFTNTGAENVAGRALQRFAGEPNRLSNLGRPLIEGTQPTLAEVSGDSGIATLQRSLAEADPRVMAAMNAQQQANNAARLQMLQGIAGSPEEVVAAEAARGQAAEALYGRAMASDQARRQLEKEAALSKANIQAGGLKQGAQITLGQRAGQFMELATPGLRELAERPTFQRAAEMAKRLAADEGVALDEPLSSLTGLHYTKLALDQMLRGAKTGAFADVSERAVVGLKDKLLQEIEKVSPQYGSAKTVFQDMSAPINRMQTGQEILRRVTGGKTALENPQIQFNPLAKLMSDLDSAAQAGTGFQKAQAADILTPDDMSNLNLLLQDVERSRMIDAGRARGSNTVQNLGSQNLLMQILSPAGRLGEALLGTGPAQTVGNVLGKVYSVTGREQVIRDALQQMVQNPEFAQQILSRMAPVDRALIEQQIGRFAAPAAIALSQ